jgi:hypothetical protein
MARKPRKPKGPSRNAPRSATPSSGTMGNARRDEPLPDPPRTSVPSKDSWRPLHWSPDRWISLCAAIVAVSALAFTIYESRVSRDFQRRSTRPRMTVAFWHDKDQAGFRLGNAGLGPALLASFAVLVDGKPQPHWTAMFESLGFARAPEYGFTVPTVESWHKSDTPASWILSVKSGPAYQRLRAEAARITITGCYRSVFDECWLFDRNTKKTPVQSCPASDGVVFSAPPLPSEPAPATELEHFAYLSVSAQPMSQLGRLLITPAGDYTVRDLQVRIVNIADLPQGANGKSYRIDNVDSQQPRLVQDIDLESADRHALNIFFSAPSGSWNQELRLRKIEGRWLHATRVTISGSYAVIHEAADPSFPRSPTGEVEGIPTLPSDPRERRYIGLPGEIRKF